MGSGVTYWMGAQSAEVAAGMVTLCFDCPSHDAWFGPFRFVEWAGLSLVFGIPSFLSGILINRKLVSTPIVFRLLLVAATAPLFWFLWFFVSDPWLEISIISQNFAQAARNVVDIFPVIVGASVVATVASFFDTLRAKQLRSPTYFADY